MNCKPGDLAILISSTFPQNIGALVEVMEPSPMSDRDWFICSLGRPLTGFDGDTDEIGTGVFGHVLDSALRPIRGEPELISLTKREGTPVWA